MKMLDGHREHLGTGRVATLEWQYLPALTYAGDTKTPNLYRHLAQDPDFFVSLVEIAYKPASWSPGDEPEPDETTRQRALNASLADTYEQEAGIHDRRAEARRRGL